jgi:hypothetical protein
MFWRSGEVIRRLREQIAFLLNENDELRAAVKKADSSRDAIAHAAKAWKEIAEKHAANLAAVRNALEESVT